MSVLVPGTSWMRAPSPARLMPSRRRGQSLSSSRPRSRWPGWLRPSAARKCPSASPSSTRRPLARRPRRLSRTPAAVAGGLAVGSGAAGGDVLGAGEVRPVAAASVWRPGGGRGCVVSGTRRSRCGALDPGAFPPRSPPRRTCAQHQGGRGYRGGTSWPVRGTLALSRPRTLCPVRRERHTGRAGTCRPSCGHHSKCFLTVG